MGKSLGYRCCVESRHGNSSCKSATVVMTNQLSQRDGASPRAGRGLFTLPYLCHFSSRSHSCSLTGQMWAAHTCGRFHVPHSLMIRHTESVCVCVWERAAVLHWGEWAQHGSSDSEENDVIHVAWAILHLCQVTGAEHHWACATWGSHKPLISVKKRPDKCQPWWFIHSTTSTSLLPLLSFACPFTASARLVPTAKLAIWNSAHLRALQLGTL